MIKRVQDATEYYAPIHHSPGRKSKKVNEDHEEMKGECYIGFQKLLNDELKAFDIKDTYIFDMKLNQSKNTLTKKQQKHLTMALPETKKQFSEPLQHDQQITM